MSDRRTQCGKGFLVGATLGTLFGVTLFVFDLSFVLAGLFTLVGAAIGGLLGSLYGDAFFDWIAERWHWFFN